MNKNLFGFLLTLSLSFGYFVLPQSVLAKTIYIDQNGDNSNSGTNDEPYKSLEKAAEEVNKGEADEVKIGKGSFSGDVTFEKGVSIQGAGKGSTTITGPLIFKKKVDLKNLAIRTKGHNAVTLGKSSAGNIKSVDIRDFGRIGIWVTGGGASLTLEDSRIGGSGGKGIYAEAGSKVNISGNSIVGNGEEGVDIRNNTRGTIKNNTIEGNSETGMEVIVGSSDLLITGNDIKRNGASGIAFQFYDSYKKIGAITATGNTLSGHRKSGIDCNKPQKGDTPVGYWADSIALEGNTFANNRTGDIGITCKLIESKTEEEEKMLQEEVDEEAKREAQIKEQDIPLEEQEKAVNEIVAKTESIINETTYDDLTRGVTQRNHIEIFFWGNGKKEVEALRIQIEKDEIELQKYQEQLEAFPVYQTHSDLQVRIADQEAKIERYKEQLVGFDNKKGILNYFHKELLNRINRVIYVFPF